MKTITENQMQESEFTSQSKSVSQSYGSGSQQMDNSCKSKLTQTLSSDIGVTKTDQQNIEQDKVEEQQNGKEGSGILSIPQ